MTKPAVLNTYVSLILTTCCLMTDGTYGAGKCTKNAGMIAPQPEWLHGYGTANSDHVFEGFQTRDGGFIAIGKTREGSNRSTDALIIKTDAKGELQWQCIIGKNGTREEGRCIAEVADGYVAGGVLTKSGETKAGLLKLDNKGQTVWTETYSHAGHGAIRSIDVTENGEIIATGYTDCKESEVPFIADEAKGFILKAAADGKLIWRKPLPVAQGTKIRTDRHNGGFVVCSTTWTFSNEEDHQDACLIKTDNDGNLLWTKKYGGPGNDQCFDFDLTTDHGYILGGHTTSYGRGGWNAWLVKISSKGNLMWHKSFGEPLGGDPKQIFDECYGVKTTLDGGFIMACGSGIEPDNTIVKKDPRNTWAAYVIRTDKTGKLLWEYTYHTPDRGHNAAEYVNLCRDGGFIVFLDSDTEGGMGAGNYGFLKLAPESQLKTSHE